MSNILFNEEAIDFQTDTVVVEQLNQLHTKIRDQVILKESFSDLVKEVRDLILKRFGIKLVFNEKYSGWGPGVYIVKPVLGIPLQNGTEDDFYTFPAERKIQKEDRLKLIKILRSKGYTVDIKNAKIIGLENVLTGIMLMPYDYIFSSNRMDQNTGESIYGWDLKPEEATAILLHEIGHVFTYYEYAGKIKKRTNVIYEAFDEYKKTDNGKKLIIKLAKELKEDELIKYQKEKGKLNMRVMTRLTVSAANYYKKEVNDARNWLETSEVVADQFVARFGLEREIIEALDKIGGLPNIFQYRLFIILNDILFSLILGFIFFFPVVWVLKVFLMNYMFQDFTYPSAKERIRRMRTELVLSLKYKKKELTSEERRRILSTIDYFDSLMLFKPTNFGQQPMLVNFFNILSAKGRASRKSEQLYKYVEELTANELRISKIKLKDVLDS